MQYNVSQEERNHEMTRHSIHTLVTGGALPLLFAVCALAGDSQPNEDLARKLEGTWEWTPAQAPECRAVKIVNRTHFMFVVYERKSGRAVMAGGGTCSFHGQTYKEKVEFGNDLPGPLELVGKEQVFTASVKDDEWIHEGTLSNGVKIREVLRRVKQGANPADKATHDPLADDLKNLQGTWQIMGRAPSGSILRTVREVQGNKETLRTYDEANAVLHEHHVDFRWEQSGRVRLYTYYNYVATAGPWKGKRQPQPISFVYRLDGDLFIEAPGLLVGDGQEPSVRIWKRVKTMQNGGKQKVEEEPHGTRI